MECKDHDQYTVKLDGTGHLSFKNCKFLRRYTPPFASPALKQPGETTNMLIKYTFYVINYIKYESTLHGMVSQNMY